MNVTSFQQHPVSDCGGTGTMFLANNNFRVYKTTLEYLKQRANGSNFFGNPVVTVGVNTITV